MKYIDIHCHLDFPDYGADFEGVLERMREKEVGAITIGTDFESSKGAVKIAEENENIWACIGIHPSDNRAEIFIEKEFERLIKSKKVVAVGECGLDYFRIDPLNLESEKKRQKDLFKQQIEFAIKHNKSLMLHCRDGYDDVLEILKNYPKVKGNCHFFAGNVEQAK